MLNSSHIRRKIEQGPKLRQLIQSSRNPLDMLTDLYLWGQVFSAVVAGGGFRGGCVVGASDARGEEVEERPVYPWDLIGSMYQLLGIDSDGSLPTPKARPSASRPPPQTASSRADD